MKILSLPLLVFLCVAAALVHKGLAKKDTPSFAENQINNRPQAVKMQPLASEEYQNKNAQPKKQLTFALHKIVGTTVYYNLYLEHNGSLLSFELPKGLSCNVGRQKTALKKADMPLDYALFEGRISSTKSKNKEGVLVFDYGTVTFDTEPTNSFMQFSVHGKRLKGGYSLEKIEKDTWVLAKQADSFGCQYKHINRLYTRSALSGKTAKQILCSAKES